MSSRKDAKVEHFSSITRGIFYFMEVINLKVYKGLYNTKSAFAYEAKAIKFKNRYYYYANGVKIKITKTDYKNVTINPRLYYLSSALKLHTLINKKLKS